MRKYLIQVLSVLAYLDGQKICTRKLSKVKLKYHRKIKCRSFRKYTPELFVQILKDLNFADYKNFDDINVAYNNFSVKLLQAINISAPLKEIRVKNDNQEWFDGEILDAILSRDKLFKKFKKSRLVNDELCYKQSKYFAQNLINDKKKRIF